MRPSSVRCHQRPGTPWIKSSLVCACATSSEDAPLAFPVPSELIAVVVGTQPGIGQGLFDRWPDSEGVLEFRVRDQEAGPPAAELLAPVAELAVEQPQIDRIEALAVGRIAEQEAALGAAAALGRD